MCLPHPALPLSELCKKSAIDTAVSGSACLWSLVSLHRLCLLGLLRTFSSQVQAPAIFSAMGQQRTPWKENATSNQRLVVCMNASLCLSANSLTRSLLRSLAVHVTGRARLRTVLRAVFAPGLSCFRQSNLYTYRISLAVGNARFARLLGQRGLCRDTAYSALFWARLLKTAPAVVC